MLATHAEKEQERCFVSRYNLSEGSVRCRAQGTQWRSPSTGITRALCSCKSKVLLRFCFLSPRHFPPMHKPQQAHPEVLSHATCGEVGRTWGPEQPAMQPPPELSQAVANCSYPFLQVHSTYTTYILLQYWMGFLDLMRLSRELDQRRLSFNSCFC